MKFLYIILSFQLKAILSTCVLLITSFHIVDAQQPSKLHVQDEKYFFQFQPLEQISYKICASQDFQTWKHLASVRGTGSFDWLLPDSELLLARRFYRAESVAAIGSEHLTGWQSFKLAEAGKYRIGLIGDSYTHARTRYSLRLKQMLAAEYGDLGAGYLSFGFHTSAGYNGSVDNEEFNYSLIKTEWIPTYGNGYGPDACHVTSAVVRAAITVRILKTVDSIQLRYVNQVGSGGFRYRINSGAWVSVATDAELGLGNHEITLGNIVAPYEIEIEALAAGVTLMGVEAVKSGDGVVVHKLAVSGGRALVFATNDLAKTSTASLQLDMAVIMFGTNEHLGNQAPWSFRQGLVNIVQTLRSSNPSIDLVFALPCYTKYELENPRAYNLQDYGAVMRSVAEEYQGAYIDFTEVFGPADQLQNLVDAGLMSSDRIHPTTSYAGEGCGGYLIANTIYKSVLSCNSSVYWE